MKKNENNTGLKQHLGTLKLVHLDKAFITGE